MRSDTPFSEMTMGSEVPYSDLSQLTILRMAKGVTWSQLVPDWYHAGSSVTEHSARAQDGPQEMERN